MQRDLTVSQRIAFVVHNVFEQAVVHYASMITDSL